MKLIPFCSRRVVTHHYFSTKSFSWTKAWRTFPQCFGRRLVRSCACAAEQWWMNLKVRSWHSFRWYPVRSLLCSVWQLCFSFFVPEVVRSPLSNTFWLFGKKKLASSWPFQDNPAVFASSDLDLHQFFVVTLKCSPKGRQVMWLLPTAMKWPSWCFHETLAVTGVWCFRWEADWKLLFNCFETSCRWTSVLLSLIVYIWDEKPLQTKVDWSTFLQFVVVQWFSLVYT